jgi:serine/threonine protein kinase
MDPDTVVGGRYRLVSVIGAGGAGVVWRAVQEPFDRVVALKQIPLSVPGGESPDRVRARTLREARNTDVLKGVDHVIGVTDYFEDSDNVWLVLEYVDALNLAELLAAAGPLPPAEVAWIGARIARALASGHERNIQHRDVKPGNVLIGRDGSTVKLGDFGISRREGDPDVTVVGRVPATLPYAAPEVVREQRTTVESDIWSLGATLYRAVEGAPPLGHHDNRESEIEAVRAGVVRPMHRAGPALQPLIERMLVVAPYARVDADTIAQKLERVAIPLSEKTRSVLADHQPIRPSRLAGAHRANRRTALVTALASAVPRHPRFWPISVRRIAIGLVIILLGAAAATGLLTGLPAPPNSASAPTATTSTTPTGVPGLVGLPTTMGDRVLGDTRSDVDPCQLVDAGALGRHGRTVVAPGYDYESCVAKTFTPQGRIRTHFEFSSSRSQLGPAPRRDYVDLEGIGIASGPFPRVGDLSCSNYVVLSDNAQIEIRSDFEGDVGELLALCRVSDTATVGAVHALDRVGHVPRDASRLAGMALSELDACDLVDPDTVPGTSVSPTAGYGRWSCRLGSGTNHRLTVKFQFGDPINHREKIGKYWVRQHSGDGTDPSHKWCYFFIEVRKRATISATRNDGVVIESQGPSSINDQCARARSVAEDVVTKLPAPG